MKLVFKIMPPAASFHGVDYNEKKEAQDVARRVHFQNFGYLQERTAITRKEFKEYFEKYSARNERVQKKQFHAILSCKENNYSHDQIKEYALQIMQRMGYGDNPLLIYAHHDTRHNHVHIVTSRIAPDGKKIAHDMEGKKANAILAELLQLDPKNVLQKDIAEVIQYRASSVPQLLLLMEMRGYETKQVGDQLLFYKHGKELSSFPFASFTPILGAGDEKQIIQVKAIIQKYQGRLSSSLDLTQPLFIRSSGKPNYESALTAYLKEKHGLQFHFFAKGNLPPYGYVIIDHKSKTVFKGSDVMSLNALIKQAVIPQVRSERTSEQNLKETKSDFCLTESSLPVASTEVSPSPEPSGLVSMFAAFEQFIDRALDGNEVDNYTTGTGVHSKKDPKLTKRKSNQRGLGK